MLGTSYFFLFLSCVRHDSRLARYQLGGPRTFEGPCLYKLGIDRHIGRAERVVRKFDQ
jgi:hypothetical protein